MNGKVFLLLELASTMHQPLYDACKMQWQEKM
jgi:hypothetical protein